MTSPTLYVATSGSRRIAYTEGTQGTFETRLTLVCIPEFGDMKEEYRKISEFILSSNSDESCFSRIISMDLRGLGESDAFDHQYSALDVAKDMVNFIKILELRNVVLCACGQSAASALFAACHLPERVFGTILISPIAWDHSSSLYSRSLEWFMLNKCAGPASVAAAYGKLYTMNPSPVGDLEEYVSNLKENLMEPHRMTALRSLLFSSLDPCIPDWNQIRLPVKLIFGATDSHPAMTSVDADIKSFEERLPQVRGQTVILPECGHFCHVECPTEVVDIINQFSQQFLSKVTKRR